MRVTAVVVAAVLGGCLLTSCGAGDSSTGGRSLARALQARDGVMLPVKQGEPCYEAMRHPLSELAAISDVPVWMPESARASRSTLTGAWTCAGGDTPILTFGDVTVSYESGYDQPLDWQRKASDSGGTVRRILGRPALLMPSTAEDIKGEAMVIVDGGVLIRVLGEANVPAEDLVAVADSIPLDEPIAS